ncbi:MAG: DUF3892 domain-containing protein [Aggregatilineales bacterium]
MTGSGFHITCANKHPNGTIVRVGGDGWTLDLHEAISQLDGRRIRLTILIGNAYFDIGIREHDNTAYLVLEPDGKPLHEVDGLNSC